MIVWGNTGETFLRVLYPFFLFVVISQYSEKKKGVEL